MVANKLSLKNSASDNSVAHRLGKKKETQGDDRRPVIAKFCRRDVKRTILTAGLTKKAETFFLSESLTPTRRTDFHTLRQMKKTHPGIVKGVTTYEGRNFVFTNLVNPAVINAQDHLLGQKILSGKPFHKICSKCFISC